MSDPILSFRSIPARRLSPVADLAPAERALLGCGATPKRQVEFAAGRAAARAAADRLLGERGRCAAIVRAEGSARPVALGRGGAPLPAHVSITHAGGVAAAAAARVPVGIDLVRVEALDGAFRREAFCPGELRGWERLTADRDGGLPATCAAFAAKEAVVKWLGTGLTIPLLGVRLSPRDRGRPVRLGGLSAIAFPLELEAPVRCELAAWLVRLGGYVVVVVARATMAAGSALRCA